ncbi:sigma-54 dependent transcriptional regulator [bacterium]|nr:sigma-54 dependent transcriptional regulator [bacterium]
MRWRILIVDDEEQIRFAFKDVLLAKDVNYKIDLAGSGEEAIVILKEAPQQYDIVLTDVRMGKVSGIDLLKWIKANNAQTDVVIITAHGDIEKSVFAMKNGATNYVAKPVDSSRLRTIVRDIFRRRRLEIENRVLKGKIREYDASLVVGNSAQINKVYDNVSRVADTDATVLIQGESGTGKEVIARALHHRSSRRKKPFVVVNCAALPSTLLENELFGHEREAFTGASSTRKGRFELADGGTIFLDEITEMSLENQSRFLRVLEDGGFHRVGGTVFLVVNVRIIAASNRNVQEMIRKELFREDLFYRLNVVPINVPPLRTRREDIDVLAQSFLREFSVRYNREELCFSDEALKLLNGYKWPGNVRELRNSIERAVILSPGEDIQSSAFPDLQLATKNVAGVPNGRSGRNPDDDTGFEPGITLQEMECRMIKHTLISVNGHRKKAAEILGISVRTLQYKIKDYDLK